MKASLRALCVVLLVGALPGGALPASGQDGLDDAIQEFTLAWSEANIDGLSSNFAPTLRLDLPERQFNVLSRRQAAAAIDAFLGGRVTSKMEVLRRSETGKDAGAGFAEIRWSSRVDGTANETTYIIFVAIVESDGAWQIEEIRVLR